MLLILQVLLGLMIFKMWKEYTKKTIDENNRNLKGNNATILRNIGHPDTVL